MANLFTRGGLQQGSGLLSERWGQQGSTVINLSQFVGGSGSETLHTVTAGKVLFITAIYISNVSGVAGKFTLTDGNGGDQKFYQNMSNVSGENNLVTFSVPLRFETSVYYNLVAAMNAGISISGWEEQPD